MEFGFRVKREKDGNLSVSLPHKCDRWGIVGDTNYGTAPEAADGLAEFSEFIDEARRAFEAYSRGEEYDAEGSPFGPVFCATFESEDACCGEGIVPGEDIRADGFGGWIHADTTCEKLAS